MSKIKKVLAMLLALAMVLGTTLTTFAEAGVTPSESDEAKATVNNVEATAEVTAYQVVKANYANGFIGYSAVDGVTIAEPTAPTSDEITAIAKNLESLSLKSVPMDIKENVNSETGLASFSGMLNPGYWMIIVKGDVKEVYNPMLLGVYYNVSGSDNGMTSEAVDANSNWKLETTDAYAKSTKPFINKEITSKDSNTNANENGGDVAVGDTVNYKITTQIPSYSKEYTSVTVNIKDELSVGLTLNHKAGEIKVSGVPSDKYTLVSTDAGFLIEIDSAWALANANEEITVEYSAVVNDKAKINFDPNTNTATLEYSNNPEGDIKTTKDETYTYTFGIGANLYGESEEAWNEITKELIKVDNTIKEEITENGETITVSKRLEGAEFKLTNDATGHEYKDVTGADGILSFTGLDAGTYTLVETKAPANYTLSTQTHKVVIAADYNTNGTLNSYSITIDGVATSTYTATYEGGKTEVSTITVVDKTTDINNTKLSSLPSTGGIGTTIFTIGGCLIMIVAAGLFFASRRKSAK